MNPQPLTTEEMNAAAEAIAAGVPGARVPVGASVHEMRRIIARAQHLVAVEADPFVGVV